MAEDLKAILEQQNSEYKDAYGFSDDIEYDFKTEKGLSEKIVREISRIKKEPEWMTEKRLTGYRVFEGKPMPQWGEENHKPCREYHSACDQSHAGCTFQKPRPANSRGA